MSHAETIREEAVALLTALLSAATIHLVLSRPVAVAMALNGPGAGQLAKAVVTLLLAAVRDLASLL